MVAAGCAHCSAKNSFTWYRLAYATEIKSIQLHDSIVMGSHKIVSSYITLHDIAYHNCNLFVHLNSHLCGEISKIIPKYKNF